MTTVTARSMTARRPCPRTGTITKAATTGSPGRCARCWSLPRLSAVRGNRDGAIVAGEGLVVTLIPLAISRFSGRHVPRLLELTFVLAMLLQFVSESLKLFELFTYWDKIVHPARSSWPAGIATYLLLGYRELHELDIPDGLAAFGRDAVRHGARRLLGAGRVRAGLVRQRQPPEVERRHDDRHPGSTTPAPSSARCWPSGCTATGPATTRRRSSARSRTGRPRWLAKLAPTAWRGGRRGLWTDRGRHRRRRLVHRPWPGSAATGRPARPAAPSVTGTSRAPPLARRSLSWSATGCPTSGGSAG